VVEPFAGLAYVHVGTDSFTESGPIAALSSTGADQNVGYSLLGVRAATTLPIAGVLVTPHGSVAWQYAFGDTAPGQALAFASTGIAFGISGVPIAQSSALIEAGLDFALGPDAMFGITYAGQLAGDLQDNGVQGRLNWRF
jgi:outer membrane autotransporter protein